MPSKIQRELALLVTGKDVSASKTLKGVSRQISGLERHSGKAASHISRNLERGVVVGAVAAAGAIGYSVNAAIEWESAIAGVNKTIEATPAELKEITDGLIAMSNRMPTSANELAAIAENAGALGIARQDILSFTETVALIGTTTNVSTDEASTALGQLSNVLGLTGQDYDNFAAALVDLGNKGASTEADILEIARRSGAAAKLIGIAKDETLGWASAAANLGLNPELGGTAIQNFFLKAQTLVGAGSRKLAKTAGMGVAEFKEAFDKDAGGALETFLVGLGKLPKDKRLKTVQSLFGKGSGLTRLILGLSDSVDKNLSPSLETSKEAWAANTAATVEFEKRAATTAAQMDILRNNVNNAAVTIGTNLLPVINELAGEGVDWMGDHQTEIAQFGKDLGEGFKEAVTWAKQLDWDAIGSALLAGAGAVRMIGEAFLGLPPPLLQLLAGGFAINKLTGGVVVDIATDALKEGIFSRGSSPANALWVRQVGGIPGAAGAGAAGAAGAGMSALSKVFLVGEAIGLALLVNEVRTGISNASTAQATAVQSQTSAFLAAQPNMGALERSLAGVDQGIHDLEANPLNVLVQGEALDKLRAMRAEIAAAIADRGPNGRDSTTQAESTKGNAGGFGQMTEAQTAAGNKVTTAVETTRGSLQTAIALGTSTSATGAVAVGLDVQNARRAVDTGASRTVTAVGAAERAARAAGAQTAAAIAIQTAQLILAMERNRPIISPTTIERTTVIQQRTGPSSGSRNGNIRQGAD